MAKVFNREKTFLDFVLRPIERLIYRATGVREEREMAWTEYGTAMLLFSAVSMLLLYMMERTQHWLLFNPQKLANVAPDLAWNTAASFTTNTNWQAYTPETTMSYLTQMAGLAYHNFASAAASVHRNLAAVGFAGRGAKLEAIRHGTTYRTAKCADDGRGRQDCNSEYHPTSNRPRPGGFAGSDKDVWHERRRLL
jgi:K+-transporting ATPase ATPase A chain